MNNRVKLGLAFGLFSILVSFVIYIVDYHILFRPKTSLFLIPLSLLFIILAGRKFLRDSPDGLLSYGTAVKNIFVALIIGSILSLSYVVIFYGNNEDMETAFIEESKKSAEGGIRLVNKLAGGSEANLENLLEEHREKERNGEITQAAYPYKLSSLPVTFLMSTFASLIFSLIAAIFVRKK